MIPFCNKIGCYFHYVLCIYGKFIVHVEVDILKLVPFSSELFRNTECVFSL